jgi:transposase-like protein
MDPWDFGNALEKVYSKSQQQRCWAHKTVNVLDKLPKKLQAKAKENIHEIYMSESKEDGFKAMNLGKLSCELGGGRTILDAVVKNCC